MGQEVLAQHFPAGASQPTSVLVPSGSADEVRRAVAAVPGVQRVAEEGGDDTSTELSVVLGADPGSQAAFDEVQAVRDAARAVDDGTLVGGADAEALDAKQASVHDQWLVIPLILAVVLVVLLLLLRSVVAAVLLVLTVVATFAASLGASWYAFEHWFGFPALDLSVPLLSFLFLVALGVDYNIFLDHPGQGGGGTPRHHPGDLDRARGHRRRHHQRRHPAGRGLRRARRAAADHAHPDRGHRRRSASCWTPCWCAASWSPRWWPCWAAASGGREGCRAFATRE